MREMKITPDLVRHEFVGVEVRVAEGKDPGSADLSGKVVDETRNTFTILHNGERKKIIKDSSIFHFTLPSGTVVEISGTLLLRRPEDRVKRRIRRLW